MKTETLRDMLNSTAYRLDNWVDPGIGSFCRQFDDVFESTPGQVLHNYAMESIHERVTTGMIYIVTCKRDGLDRVLLAIPSSIFDAKDPREAALDWALDVQVENQRHQLATAQRHVAASQKTLDRLLSERKTIQKGKP